MPHASQVPLAPSLMPHKCPMPHASQVARALGVDVSDVEFDESAVQATRASNSLTLSLVLLVVAIALTVAHASYF